MPTHAAFLKGMNLGNRRLTNEELRGHFEAIGMSDVATRGARACRGRRRARLRRARAPLVARRRISESALDMKALERALRPVTIRTRGTLEQIAARHFGA